ncbi:MFS general substrate transporter [Thozetella sp. PMI_491]|nr:MFS general substrate transporter [Thozetella sp. PMI_491]
MAAKAAQEQEPIGWRDLPQKGNLTVLALARFCEPLVQTSLQSYMYPQLKLFDANLSDAALANQAGILYASFTAAQCVMAVIWGRIADSPRFGRKFVLLLGLLVAAVSCIGFGLSTSFLEALAFRFIGGAAMGNVGVLRTITPSKKLMRNRYQSRAFLVMPIMASLGTIVGPAIGGVLSGTANSQSTRLEKMSFWLRFPYAYPNLVTALFLLSVCTLVWLGLDETLDTRLHKRDLGRQVTKILATFVKSCVARRAGPGIAYMALVPQDTDRAVGISCNPIQQQATVSARPWPPVRYKRRLSFRSIFTRNLILTFTAHSLLAFHVGAFNSLWPVFLSTPVFDPSKPDSPKQRLPFIFTGGLGFPPPSVGMAMGILGSFGVWLQIFLYPKISANMGNIRSLQTFSLCFPCAYFFVPYLSLVRSETPAPHAKDGIAVWVAVASLVLVQVTGRTFTLPAQLILIHNCAPHPSVLGTVHSLAQGVDSAARTIGLVLCGYWYSLGLDNGIVGAVWWGLACIAICGALVSSLVTEGDGHEIWLQGDEEA